jgi:hypothetical protein
MSKPQLSVLGHYIVRRRLPAGTPSSGNLEPLHVPVTDRACGDWSLHETVDAGGRVFRPPPGCRLIFHPIGRPDPGTTLGRRRAESSEDPRADHPLS